MIKFDRTLLIGYIEDILSPELRLRIEEQLNVDTDLKLQYLTLLELQKQNSDKDLFEIVEKYYPESESADLKDEEPVRRSFRLWPVAIAASFLVFIAVGWLIYSGPYQRHTTSRKVTLVFNEEFSNTNSFRSMPSNSWQSFYNSKKYGEAILILEAQSERSASEELFLGLAKLQVNEYEDALTSLRVARRANLLLNDAELAIVLVHAQLGNTDSVRAYAGKAQDERVVRFAKALR